MPGNGHVRFGRRAAETDRQKRRHRAAARPHNRVYDPAFLMVAWERVAKKKGAQTPGIDRARVAWIESRIGVEVFLQDIRAQLKARLFQPVAVRQVMIPKPSGKLRRLGIPTVTDRVVQAALKLVLEPIFEAGFHDEPFLRPRGSACLHGRWHGVRGGAG